MKKSFLFFIVFYCSNIKSQDNLFDLKQTPFSCRGSWMALSAKTVNDTDKLFIRDICGRRMWQDNHVFMIEPVNEGKIIKPVYRTDAAKIEIKAGSSQIEITYEKPEVMRIRGKGTGMRMTMTAPRDGSSLVIPVGEGQWRLQMGGFPHFAFTTLKGKTDMIKGSRFTINLVNDKYEDKKIEMVLEIKPGADGTFEAAIVNYDCGWEPKSYTRTFDNCVTNLNADFDRWCSNSPQPLKGYEKTTRLANYINWSCIVNPRGLIDRPMMLSSKNHMHALWTWDTWFFSIATSYKMPEFAWNTAMFHAKHQDAVTGLIPNLTTDVNYMWGFGYPCIWGWAIRKMIEHNPSIGSDGNLRMIYEPLCKATDFWFTYQDDDKDGLPQYDHTNDSGMDNSTAGDIGMSIEAPDLAAYLVIQMDMLSAIASKIGKPDEAKRWKQRSDVLLDKMLKELWTGKKFVAKRTDDNQYNDKSQSILLYMPLILGNRLPAGISKIMIDDLKTNGMFTKVGLCSENPNGSLYTEDSYWRGPVWSPPTYIIASGVWECGDIAFAKEIAKRYCDNCVKNGFGENFDPFTGASLKDKSLPWTAAIFSILQEDFLK